MATVASALLRVRTPRKMDGWRFLASVLFGMVALQVLGIGADPTRVQRHAVTVASFDWLSPGVDGPIAGTSTRYRRFDPAAGSLESLASHELRNELDRTRAAETAAVDRAPDPVYCQHSSLGDRLVLGDQHGRIAPSGHPGLVAATGRDGRERVLISGGKLPAALIPDNAPDDCALPSAFQRLADFVPPPRIARMMGYLDAGYFAPV